MILSNAKYFTFLDLLMNYHQVEIDTQHRVRTAFLTHRNLDIYIVMPFRVCNAPAPFRRLIERVLGPLINVGVLATLDKVLIYANTLKQLI